ncbi:hypothetical protein EON63_18950 [archaeon]|nr:MAG: hypothetical protein EON63_18950 [archaeon]
MFSTYTHIPYMHTCGGASEEGSGHLVLPCAVEALEVSRGEQVSRTRHLHLPLRTHGVLKAGGVDISTPCLPVCGLGNISMGNTHIHTHTHQYSNMCIHIHTYIHIQKLILSPYPYTIPIQSYQSSVGGMGRSANR